MFLTPHMLLCMLLGLHLYMYGFRLAGHKIPLFRFHDAHMQVSEHANASGNGGSARSIEVNKYHIILMYPKLHVSKLCTLESLVLALLKSRSNSTGVNLKRAILFVWMTNATQQGSFFENLEQKVRESSNPPSVSIVRKEIAFEEEIEGPLLHDFYKGKEKTQLGRYAEQNKGNALRLALIRKHGGMYIDSDMLVLNDPSFLEDGLAMESNTEFNDAVFKFSPGHPAVELLVNELVETYNGNKRGWQGPLLFTRVFRNCTKNNRNSSLLCRGFQLRVWNGKDFYPYGWRANQVERSFDRFIKRYNVFLEKPPKEIMFKWWHKKSKRSEARMCAKGLARYSQSFLGHMKSTYCPRVTLEAFQIKKGEEGYCEF